MPTARQVQANRHKGALSMGPNLPQGRTIPFRENVTASQGKRDRENVTASISCK
jgi:hypothetical protein